VPIGTAAPPVTTVVVSGAPIHGQLCASQAAPAADVTRHTDLDVTTGLYIKRTSRESSAAVTGRTKVSVAGTRTQFDRMAAQLYCRQHER
jgi:hypothetical protein